LFADPVKSKGAKEAARLAQGEVEKLKAFMHKIDREQQYDTLICIGIGGSDLGPKAHYIALEPLLKKGRSVRFISNLDPDDAAAALKGVELRRALVAVISKSGTTLETLANEEFVRSFFIQKGLKPEQHFIAITGEESPMDDPTRYLQVFYIW